MDDKIIQIAAETLGTDIETVTTNYREIPEINAWYFWEPVRGGVSVIINSSYEIKCNIRGRIRGTSKRICKRKTQLASKVSHVEYSSKGFLCEYDCCPNVLFTKPIFTEIR